MKPISVGDLVMVVHSCCNDRAGLIGVVESFHRGGFTEILTCDICGRIVGKCGDVSARVSGGDWPIPWLKRLDPDALNDSIPTKEEVSA